MVRGNRWKEEQNHRETHHESRGKANANITIAPSPVFSSQEDGWDKHASNAPDTPHIYQRLLISEHILWLFKTKDLWLSYARGRSISEILKLMSAEWTSGEEHMWVITWRRRQPPLWQGSLLDPLQNKSNEGDLKKCNHGNFTGSSDRSEVCQKRLVHTWREPLRHISPPPTFALRFFSRSVKEKVQRMHLVFLKPGIWQRPQVAINNSTKKNHFEKQA